MLVQIGEYIWVDHEEIIWIEYQPQANAVVVGLDHDHRTFNIPAQNVANAKNIMDTILKNIAVGSSSKR